MEIYPTPAEVKRLSQDFDNIPVMTEVIADMLTPVNLFLSLKQQGKGYDYCFLFESAENGAQFGRYSFIGFDPHIRVTFSSGMLEIVENGQISRTNTTDPFGPIEALGEKYKSPVIPGMPKFTGGLTGYFGYDTIRYVEPTVNCCPPDDLGIPEIHLMGCRDLIVFDHLKHSIILITNLWLKEDGKDAYAAGEKRLEKLKALIREAKMPAQGKSAGKPVITTLLTKEQHMANVEKAKAYIRNGDIFQVVLSQRMDVENPPDPFNVYRMLRGGNPSPYMYYLNFGETVVVGSSPEMLVSVEDGVVATNPIAGTIRRGKTPQEDALLEKQLLADEKELAEHTMLVDLGRNDIGRICRFGTVNVTKFMEVEKYSKVMHIVSQVAGNLMENYGPLDALKSVLPAGTLSGAPKIRAMQIIDQLEPRKRGLYGGAIGYLGYNGVLDTCIAIRTALYHGGKAYIQAGGGIVADSQPEKEYEEAMNKASAVLTAMEKAGELL